MSETARDYLLSLAERYRLCEHTVQLTRTRLIIWSTTSVDELLTDDTDPDEIPYWAELWPSAIALARHIESRGQFHGKRVLELGCGTALPSIAASLREAEVTATDYVEDALEFARANAALNGARNILFRLLDWRRPPMLGHFDVVIGADILYERKLHDSLYEVLRDTAGPGSTVIIADPCRPAAVGFVARLEREGWQIGITEDHLPGTIHEDIMIYTLTKGM